jgi:hypothetical protein
MGATMSLETIATDSIAIFKQRKIRIGCSRDDIFIVLKVRARFCVYISQFCLFLSLSLFHSLSLFLSVSLSLTSVEHLVPSTAESRYAAADEFGIGAELERGHFCAMHGCTWRERRVCV